MSLYQLYCAPKVKVFMIIGFAFAVPICEVEADSWISDAFKGITKGIIEGGVNVFDNHSLGKDTPQEYTYLLGVWQYYGLVSGGKVLKTNEVAKRDASSHAEEICSRPIQNNTNDAQLDSSQDRKCLGPPDKEPNNLKLARMNRSYVYIKSVSATGSISFVTRGVFTGPFQEGKDEVIGPLKISSKVSIALVESNMIEVDWRIASPHGMDEHGGTEYYRIKTQDNMLFVGALGSGWEGATVFKKSK